MFVAIDIGNTMLKAAFFIEGAAEELLVLPAESHVDEFVAGIERWLSHSDEVEALAICSGHWPYAMPKEVKRITAESNWPLEMHYDTPQTLGLDRLLLANATWLEFQQDLLVITLGTCITYNIVKNDAFIGGAISPGWAMRYKAMHAFTEALPHLVKSSETHVVGASTEESMWSGVDTALPLEMSAMIHTMQKETGIKLVIICGGDAKALSNHLKSYIFAPSNYELYALQRIDEYFKSQSIK